MLGRAVKFWTLATLLVLGAVTGVFSKPKTGTPVINRSSDDSRPSASFQLSNSLDQFFNANRLGNVQALQDTSIGVISAFFSPVFLDRRNLNSSNLDFLRSHMFVLFKDALEAHRSELSRQAVQILIDELEKQIKEMEARSDYKKIENIWPSVFTGIGFGLVGEGLVRGVLGVSRLSARLVRRPARPVPQIQQQQLKKGDSTFKRSCKTIARSISFVGTRLAAGSLLGIPAYYLFFRSNSTYAPMATVTKVDLRLFLNDFKTSLELQNP